MLVFRKVLFVLIDTMIFQDSLVFSEFLPIFVSLGLVHWELALIVLGEVTDAFPGVAFFKVESSICDEGGSIDHIDFFLVVK